MPNLKKLVVTCSMFLLFSFILTGCAGKSSSINVVSREDGSGTRDAFTEIVGLIEEQGDEKVDLTYEEAVIQNSTDGVMTTVKGDKDSIGYISTGSLNDTIKALKIDGVEASQENIKSGNYKISRPFLVTYKEGLDELGEDFLDYILSHQGQEVVLEEGFIPVDSQVDYEAKELSGKITVSGSTSVTPVMEKLKEAYEALNPEVTIEIQSPGSSAGIKASIDGTSDFGMSSRDLKDEESDQIKSDRIAVDGIAVIVNKDNRLDDLSLEEVKEIFKGEITSWSDLN